MGVSGCGKSTLARSLAASTGGVFLEGDDFHPLTNKAKMAAGIPLTDADRDPWYATLIAAMQSAMEHGGPVFLSCSALKRSYRQRLRDALPGLRFVYLRGDYATLHARMESRAGHFMPASLLRSQLETLEEPADALVFDVRMAPDAVLAASLEGLGLPDSPAQS